MTPACLCLSSLYEGQPNEEDNGKCLSPSSSSSYIPPHLLTQVPKVMFDRHHFGVFEATSPDTTTAVHALNNVSFETFCKLPKLRCQLSWNSLFWFKNKELFVSCNSRVRTLESFFLEIMFSRNILEEK